MFSQPTAPVSRKKAEEQRRNIVLGSGAAVILVLFLATYLWGSKKQTKISQKQAGEIKSRGEFLRKQLKQCQNGTRLRADKAVQLQGDAARLWSSNRQLEDENDRLLAVNDEMEHKKVECEENTKLTKQSWTDEDRLFSGKVWELQSVNAKLTQQVQRLSNSSIGMRSTILNALLQSLSKEHQKLRLEYDGMKPTVDRRYVDELVSKWQKIDAELVAAGKPGPMSSREGEVLPINASERVTPEVTVLDRYDPDRHAKTIFIPRRGKDGNWQLPGWNGRQGTQKLRMGVYVRSKLNPVTTVNRQMRVLYEYALCALSKNITKFMYPSRFKRCATCKDDWLHNYIETPLVFFCDDCRPQHTTNAFKLLCAGTSAEAQYGGELFWRMRSRLIFKGAFRTKAEAWMLDNFFRVAGLDPKDKDKRWGKTISVRLPHIGDPDWPKTCEVARTTKRPILAYTKLLKGRDGVTELSSDVDEQCSPPRALVKQAVNAKIKEMSQGEDVRVYVSAGRNMTEAEWYQLQGDIDAPLYRRRPTERATEDDVIDTLISASCDVVFVNRFDIKSTQILESHLLYNGIDVKGTAVW
eukprot:TRINITY_DN36_c0_g2_i6.p1 TRINITY_DN36_c0_g2~~TRINITY_DN36_c0_g2_i6.p1  ORF type:complete len:581 (+),score=240.10 TRINITY_DN36_c0_g2_i6:131-1873(+)